MTCKTPKATQRNSFKVRGGEGESGRECEKKSTSCKSSVEKIAAFTHNMMKASSRIICPTKNRCAEEARRHPIQLDPFRTLRIPSRVRTGTTDLGPCREDEVPENILQKAKELGTLRKPEDKKMRTEKKTVPQDAKDTKWTGELVS